MTCHLFLGRPGHGRDLFVKSKYQTPPSLTAGAVKLTSKPPFTWLPFSPPLFTTTNDHREVQEEQRKSLKVLNSVFFSFFKSPLKNNNSEYANKQRHSWKKKSSNSKRAEIRRRKCVCVHATRLQITFSSKAQNKNGSARNSFCVYLKFKVRWY